MGSRLFRVRRFFVDFWMARKSFGGVVWFFVWILRLIFVGGGWIYFYCVGFFGFFLTRCIRGVGFFLVGKIFCWFWRVLMFREVKMDLGKIGFFLIFVSGE